MSSPLSISPSSSSTSCLTIGLDLNAPDGAGGILDNDKVMIVLLIMMMIIEIIRKMKIEMIMMIMMIMMMMMIKMIVLLLMMMMMIFMMDGLIDRSHRHSSASVCEEESRSTDPYVGGFRS